MSLQIAKVKDSEGVILEKYDMNTMSVTIENGSIQLHGKHVIKRSDGVDVQSSSPAYLNIPIAAVAAGAPAGNIPAPASTLQLSETEIAQIQTALAALKSKIVQILDTKAEIV